MLTDNLNFYQTVVLILKRMFLILMISLLTAHIATLLYYLVADNGQHSLFIKRTNPDFEVRRQLLLKNMPLVDKLFTVGYTFAEAGDYRIDECSVTRITEVGPGFASHDLHHTAHLL